MDLSKTIMQRLRENGSWPPSRASFEIVPDEVFVAYDYAKDILGGDAPLPAIGRAVWLLGLRLRSQEAFRFLMPHRWVYEPAQNKPGLREPQVHIVFDMTWAMLMLEFLTGSAAYGFDYPRSETCRILTLCLSEPGRDKEDDFNSYGFDSLSDREGCINRMLAIRYLPPLTRRGIDPMARNEGV